MTKELHELELCANPKERLLEYVKENNKEGIIDVIGKDRSLLQANYEKYFKPILHIACDDLAKDVKPETINTLINEGANMYQPIRGGYQAIHSAVRGKNPRILETLIERMTNKEEGVNATVDFNTALNILVKSANVEGENFNECLRILLQAGIDVNIADRNNITPILWAAQRGHTNIVRAILECGRYVDIDSHSYRDKTARAYIRDMKDYDGPLPDDGCDTNKNTTWPLQFQYILRKRQDEFIQLEEINVNDAIAEGTLLQLASERRLLNIIRYLLARDVDLDKTTEQNKILPLKIAAKNGYHNVFSLLIDKYKELKLELPDGILSAILTNWSLRQDNDVNYRECFNTLLELDDVPVNEYSETKNTPLHYSGFVTDPEITRKLLEKGASLANENKYKSLPVEEIDPKILEKHFDSCITVKELCSTDKRRIVASFDYSSLIPTGKPEESKDPNIETGLIQKNVKEPVSETGVINVLSKTPEMRHLLVHPLISSFIRIKCYRMRWFIKINLILFLLFALSFFAHIFIPNDDTVHDDYKIPINMLQALLILTYFTLIFRELLQLVLSPKTYCRSWSNALEVAMLVISFYPIFWKPGELLHKQLSSIALVLIALELMVLLARHPAISTYMVMLRTVAKNFFYFLAWYAILIVAFALSFYNLFKENSQEITTVKNTTCQNDNEEKELNFFDDIGLTVVKTIVMLTGEFDASSIDFDSFWNRIIFLIFVFMIPIILFNLLNGLAVSDTQQIKSEAEVIGYSEMVSYVVYVESIILGNAFSRNAGCLFANCASCWMDRLRPPSLIRLISLIPDFLPEMRMDILLYYKGLIIRNKEMPPEGCINYCRNLRVDDKTVKRVKQLLNERSRESEKHEEVDRLKEIIKYQAEVIEQCKREIGRLRTEVD